MKETGQRLKILRKSMKLTQTQMADLLGLKQASINKYEHGNATPVIETLKKYADYFDVSMDYIFARTDDPKGKKYGNDPQFLANDIEKQKMLDMYFDPESPFHARLKQMLLQILEETRNELNKN